MQNTMKSPLMDNTDDMNDTADIKHMTPSERRERLIRNSSRNSISTQTSVNYNLLSPLSIQNSILSSTQITSAVLCRICYNGDGKEHLLQPCDCSGTMGLIHKTCLEKWLSQSNKNQCEICNFNYDVKRDKRPFSQWLFRPITNKDSKNLLNDVLCFLILTPLAFISTWYCVGFAFKYTESVNKWESSGLVILTTFLVIIYFLWLIFSSRYHYKVFLEWQEKNQIVTLKIDKSKVILTSHIVDLKRKISEKEVNLENDTTIENCPSVDINVPGSSNDNLQSAMTNKKPIYRKQSDVEFKVESCIIEV